MATRKVALPSVSSVHREALTAARGATQAQALTAAPNARAAPLVVTLPPSAFSQNWPKRPQEPVRIGLRLVSESVADKARASAATSADRHYPAESRDSQAYADHYNGVLIRAMLAEAMCQAHDASAPWFATMAADMVGVALGDKGALRLWQGYSELRELLSPLLRLATEDDLADLSTRLASADAIGQLHDGDRRLLARILDDLRERAVTSPPS